MRTSAPLTVGLFGAGHPHSAAHLKTLALSTLVGEVVLFDADPATAERLRESHPDKVKRASLYPDGLSGGEVDVAVAAFRNDLNAELCLRLIRAGIPVLSEKPIGRTAAEVRRVVEAARAKGLPLGVMYQNRYSPLTQEARRLLQEGVIGRVTGCEARLITSQIRFRDPSHWLFDAGKSGGGILSWLGCHYLDMMCYVTGDRVQAVSAMVGTLSGEAIDVEDVASMSLRFRSGAIGSLQTGYQLALSRGGYIGPSYETYVGIRGTAGRVWWEPAGRPAVLHVESAQASWAGSPARQVRFELPESDAYGGGSGLRFVEDFLRAASGAGEAPSTGDDALHIARVVEAAYESSREGRHVRIEDGEGR